MSEQIGAGAAGPLTSGERVGELDALRGFALFGVFAANLTGFPYASSVATEAQLAALPSAGLDRFIGFFIEWLIHDKANTLFAFLFGLGFWLQMRRLTARGVAFERVYVRRLAILLLIGLLHMVFLWNWDILHVYALAGFGLFFLRGVSDRALLIGGIALAVFGRLFVAEGIEWTGHAERMNIDAAYADEAVLARQAVALGGDYFAIVRMFLDFARLDWIHNGLFLGWFFYALGRFMVGAFVGRRGWLDNAGARLSAFRRWLMILLPAGLVGELAATLLETGLKAEIVPESAALKLAAETIHLAATPVLAAGYVCAVVVALHSARLQRLVRPLAHVGRMALTNYVAQSFIIGFVLFGVGPGLALAGKIGTAALFLIVVAGYAAQVGWSAFWLKRFAYGPLEWVWRALTYGTLPRLRLAKSKPGPAAL